MMRSDDFGESWAPTGGGGNPTVLPTYPQDGAILAASGGTRADYVLRHGASNDVTGSNNAEVDVQFRLSPDYPSGGGYSPVVLGAEDPVHEVPVVFRCSADFTCNQPVHLRVPTNEFNFSIAQIDLTLAGDYPRSGVVFANTSVGIQKSIDGGASFTPVTIVPTAGAAATFTPGFALAPGYREAGPVRTAYAAVLQYFDNQGRDARSLGGIYRTTDGGASWTPLASTGLFAKGAHSIAVAPDGRMFAGYDEGAGRMGLVCSTDATTWRPTCPPVGDHPVSAADEAALVSAAARQAPASSFPTLLVVTASVLAGICLAVGVWSARWTRRRSRRGVS